ncbi:hypothetical protein B0I71DRAFT_143803 [Yarrowia lipolytica]|uniref:Uncharacterized protein n=1 Tax=Yarrowia lipolytica TaxID=4952 RepID=A0A371BWU1_YARLL|nr:hypothetical protein B0I71DRAFT_143803 [Yarrowia lipolytica]
MLRSGITSLEFLSDSEGHEKEYFDVLRSPRYSLVSSSVCIQVLTVLTMFTGPVVFPVVTQSRRSYPRDRQVVKSSGVESSSRLVVKSSEWSRQAVKSSAHELKN